ncbi:MAG: winged helix-turn-helix transcriptional regulator [Nitrososphaerota archaeon]
MDGAFQLVDGSGLKAVLCKWSIAVLNFLYDGPRSFSEIARGLNVSNKVLSEKLSRLSRIGLVSEQTGNRMIYKLTSEGREFAEVTRLAVSQGINPLELRCVLTCKWMPQILGRLVCRDLYASELYEKIDGISWKVLSEMLRKLESYQMIKRDVVGSHPIRVRYKLDTKGRIVVRWILINSQNLKRLADLRPAEDQIFLDTSSS